MKCRQLFAVFVATWCLCALAQNATPGPSAVQASVAFSSQTSTPPAGSDQDQSPKIPPLQPATTLDPNRTSCSFGKIKREPDQPKEYVVFGTFDVSKPCVPPQFETTVSNRQKVALDFAPNAKSCKAAPTFKADEKADVGGILAAFLTSAAGVHKLGGGGHFFDLPPAMNGTMTLVITCTPAEAGVFPTTVIIHYRDAPLFSASAGSLVSFFPKRVLGVSTSQTGVNASGVATTQNTVAVTSSSKVQFVPIAFLNTHMYGPNKLHLDFQTGAGINPNGSKTEVEYFLGPALSSHGVYVSPGLHIARASYLTNGFTLGEAIPSGVTPAVSYRATYRFAIALSYSPPVKSGK